MNCPSCGGEYADWAQKCPYCGTVNEAADEKLYLEHLEQIRQRLDNVDEEAEQAYKKDIGSSVGRIGRTALAVLAAVLLVSALAVGVSAVSSRRTEAKNIRQSEWENEEFAVLDAWYASGEFEEIIKEDERLFLSNSDYYLYNWPHYNFVFDYWMSYHTLQANLENWAECSKDEVSLSNSLYCAAMLKYGAKEDVLKRLTEAQKYSGRFGLTEEEALKVREFGALADVLFRDKLGWSEETAAAFLDEAVTNDYVKISVCDKRAEELIKEGRT